jgi:hypothetical protein
MTAGCHNHGFPWEKPSSIVLKTFQDGKLENRSKQKTSEPTYDSFGAKVVPAL